MGKTQLILGSTLAALAVMIGAFGAHGLHDVLLANDRLATFETAVQYHMYHALAILVIGLLQKSKTHQLLTLAGYLFLAGVLIFSGSLYILSITDFTILGAITPIGGLVFIAGWVVMISYFIRTY